MAIKKSTLKDGLVFINDDNPGESVIVNFYTFVSLVKGIMVAYGNKSEGEAESIINNSPMLTVLPQNYLEACLLGHEEEYYWAMVISHGYRYFEKGFSYSAPDSYDEWESKYIKDNNLKTNALIFKDEE
ncbi:hypothetical protein [Kosakonia sp. CFBP8986]|uniref:hypothetical protein n=1 Tax=Kosakonia sp. CFBP8986 TaxID=3096524 RepID=UPI002A6A6FB9|nr:hypothetical protein [Kosakonia sp. CFBP8986]MDY0886088.1 hypothetical protein [Kosakonia sp. CFBP8986]